MSLRKKHYGIQPGDVLVYRGKIALAKGVHCNGTRAVLENNKSVKIADLSNDADKSVMNYHYDYIIENNDSFEVLRESAETLLKELKII